MFGIIHYWKVRPGAQAQHRRVMAAVLDAERRLAPEVLVNLTLGPDADGLFAEVQIYPDRAASERFGARAGETELGRLWAELDTLTVPGSARSAPFEQVDHLAQSFVRDAARLGFVEGRHRLVGKVALVTGAWRGNGRGIAEALAREGADLALVDLDEERLADTRAAVEALGRRCVTLAADVADEAAAAQAVAATAAALGGLDILVNNAGLFPFKPLAQFTADEFERVWQVNVKGPWLLTKAALPHLAARGEGAVVNIASCSGHHGGASAGGSAYDSSKAALRQLTTSLAVELGPQGIRVNALSPGVIATEAAGGEALSKSAYGRSEIARTPLGRLGAAADVGAVAAFLAGPDAAFVTGITVILDGGAMAAW